MQFIDLQAQYQQLKKRIDSRIQSVLNHGQYIMGPEINELEEKLADYVGVKHVVSCANGTDALQLCLMTLDIKAGDGVFCPTFTYFATAEAIAITGATPVFVDSEEKTFNICCIDLEKRIQKTIAEGKLTPKAIIAVDLFGLPARYPELESIANKYGIKLIEDAAQGFGGEINGRRAGSFGDIATTSFFPAKPLGCYGDGGAIFTNNSRYAELLRSYRVHGKGSNKYDNVRIGMNSRLDTIQAAILLEKLVVFPRELRLRNEIALEYSSKLGELLTSPEVPTGYSSSWAQYTVLNNRRKEWIDKLEIKNIPSMIYYKTCLHQQEVFRDLKDAKGEFPLATAYSKKVFSLPMHPYLRRSDLSRIINVLLNR